jgi:hypothetical protein
LRNFDLRSLTNLIPDQRLGGLVEAWLRYEPAVACEEFVGRRQRADIHVERRSDDEGARVRMFSRSLSKRGPEMKLDGVTVATKPPGLVIRNARSMKSV